MILFLLVGVVNSDNEKLIFLPTIDRKCNFLQFDTNCMKLVYNKRAIKFIYCSLMLYNGDY